LPGLAFTGTRFRSGQELGSLGAALLEKKAPAKDIGIQAETPD